MLKSFNIVVSGLFLIALVAAAKITAQTDSFTLLIMQGLFYRGGTKVIVDAMDLQTGTLRQLVQGEQYQEMTFDVSPNGRYLAYGVSDALSSEYEVAYYVLDTENPDPVLIAERGIMGGTTSRYMFPPVWSPDSSRAAVYHVNEDDDSQLTLFNVETSESVAIPVGDLLLQSPQWSPDSTMITFTTDFSHALADDTFVAPTDGSEPPRRLTYEDESIFFFGWMPDSQHIFATHTEGYISDVGRTWYMVYLDNWKAQLVPRPDGILAHPLAVLENGRLLIDSRDGDDHKARVIDIMTGVEQFVFDIDSSLQFVRQGVGWGVSPDRSRFAVESEAALYLYDLNTGAELAEIDLPTSITRLLWTPDGNQLIYQLAAADEISRVFSVNADGTGEPREIAQISGYLVGLAHP